MFYLAKCPSKAKLVIVKKIFLLLAFITWMVMNGQVVVDTIFTTTEEIHFVSDDGGGMYTVSGPGAGDDGFLAIYDEGADSWEYKSFPAKTNVGSVHDASTENAFSFGNETFATGVVAVSTTSEWRVVRKYVGTSYSVEKMEKNVGLLLYKAGNDLYGVIGIYSNSDLLNTGWNLPGEGMYLVKFNKQDLSLDWSYRVCSTWNNTEWRIQTQDNLISTNKAYRYAVQQLPNGNIAVTVSRVISGNPGGEYQLWEFDPATGQKLGVIDDSYTDYDRDGVAEMQYRFHRWKVVDGVLFHEFWNDPNNSQDQNVGHWEKLEVPGWAPGSGNVNTSWDSSQLQVTAVSDEGTFDSFRSLVRDFWITQNGEISFTGKTISGETFSTIKREDIFYTNNDSRDTWYRSNGDRMVMDSHGLYKVRYNEVYSQRITLNPNGNNVVDSRDDEYWDGGWQARYGEGTLVLSGTLPSVGSAPDPSWWSIPQGFHWNWNSNIMESHRPTDNGRRYFIVEAESDSNNPRAYLEYRIWVVDANAVSVPETEISGLSLYPNPVESFLTVEADEGVDAIRVYNMSGVAVKEADGNARVFMGDLPAGVYVVEITAGEAVSRRKVIKK